MQFNYSFYDIVLKENRDFVYLYNSYSGALCKLEKEIHNHILNNVLDDNDKCKYFDDLLKQGFIKPVDLNEFNKILTMERSAIYGDSEEKLTFVIAPTLACNLSCVYCFEDGFKSNKFMSDKIVDEVVKYIEQKINKGTKSIHITWFGGEPLLAYKTIVLFNQKLNLLISDKSINYTSSMISNGILLTEDKVKYLAEECNLKNIQITIDGTEETYCKQKKATPLQFRQVLQNIKNAIKYLKISIRFNCGKENFSEIVSVVNQILELCSDNENLNLYLARLVDYSCGCSAKFFTQEEFDLKYLEFNKFICQKKDKEFKPKLPKYRKSYCGLFKLKNLVIGPDGEFYKCEHYVGRDEKIIGNIRQGLFYTDNMLDFLSNKMYEKCKECKLFPLCVGGCPAQKQDLGEKEACSLSLEYIKNLLKTYIKD